MAEYSYNPAIVSLVVQVSAAAGLAQSSFKLQGFADGTFIRIARSNPTFSKRVSADGVVRTRSKRNDSSGTIAVILEEGSDSNALLDALEKADNDTGQGFCTLTCKDNSGNEAFNGKNCYVTQPPDAEKASEAGTREWMFECLHLDMNVRGMTQI